MATVFMKWLETSPGDYDRGIRLLTLGRIATIKQAIAEKYVAPGDRVLEIGCWTPDFERRKVIFHDPQLCIACGACVLQCPEDAIRLE